MKRKRLKLVFPLDIENEYLSDYVETVRTYHKDHVELVNKLTNHFNNDLHFVLSGCCSRNAITDPLFHYFCYIQFVRKLKRENKLPDIIEVDSTALGKELLKKLSDTKCQVKVLIKNKPFSLKYRTWFNKLKQQLKLFFYYKYKKKKPCESKTENLPLALIDCFIVNNKYEKRYYPGLWELLTEKTRTQVRFVPCLYNENSYKKLIVDNTANQKFLFIEEFLTLYDYIWSFLCLLKLFKYSFFLKKMVKHFERYEQDLIQETIHNTFPNPSMFTGLLYYRFFKQLKKNKINLKLTIDWFENQPIDKAWNKGVHTFFPHIKTKGYIGFISPEYHYSGIPTSYEFNNNYIPKDILVTGHKLKKRYQSYSCTSNIEIAPSFRNAKFFETKDNNTNNKKKKNCILAGLSIYAFSNRSILDLIISYINENDDPLEVVIKPHPATTPDTIRSTYKKPFPKSIKFILGDINNEIDKYKIFVSSGTGLAMEILARGIPVIIIGSPNSLTLTYIPDDVNKDIYKIVYNIEEFNDAIDSYKQLTKEKLKEFAKIGEYIKENYFTPVNKDTVAKFLDI